MVYKSLKSDFFYSNSGITSLSYYVTCSGETIYTGKAYNFWEGIKINIRKIVEDWLWNDMPDFRDFDGVLVEHPEAMRVFGLYTDEGTLLEEYEVLLSHEEYDGTEIELIRPINAHADPRQKVFLGGVEPNPQDPYVAFPDGDEDCMSPSVNTTRKVTVRTNVYNITVTTSDAWLTATYTHGRLTYTAAANSSGATRTGYVYLSADGTLLGTYTVTQDKACAAAGDGTLSWVESYELASGLKENGPVQVTPSYLWAGPAFDNKPASGGRFSIEFYTRSGYVELVLTKDGVEVERVTPVIDIKKGLYHGVYTYDIPANTGSTPIEYILTPYGADGNILLAGAGCDGLGRATPNVVYIIQPPEVDPAYIEPSAVSGTQWEYRYYQAVRTAHYGEQGYPVPGYTEADALPAQFISGSYFKTDASAIAAGYPKKGGYNSVFKEYASGDLHWWNQDSGYTDWSLTYFEWPDTEWNFSFGLRAGMDAVLLPNVKTLFKPFQDLENTEIGHLYAPRALRMFATGTGEASRLNGKVTSLNVWSMVTILGGDGIGCVGSGMTELYLPNIGYISRGAIKNLNVQKLYLGKTLRFFALNNLDSEVLQEETYYLGTVDEFKEHVRFAPKGIYHCTDGDYDYPGGYNNP